MTKLKILIAIAICGMAVSGALAQVNTPYSMYGYGILGDRATSMQRQMGGVGYAMNSGRQINVMNPASYAAIDSLTFLFDIGADVSMIWSREDSARKYATGGGLDYVTMQFPISKFMGGSIGMLPYSSVGYAFGNDIAHGTMENQGSGGINELYLGLSGKVKGFSLGVNVSYDYGNIVNDVFATPPTGSVKTEHVMRIRDWNVVIGAQYTQNIGRFSRMVIGATYSPKKTLLGKTWVTTQEMTQESLPTYVAEMSLKNNYFTPNSFGFGLNYSRERVSRWSVELDYSWQGWKDAEYSPVYATDDPKEIVFQGMNFNNRQRVAVGGEFMPKVRGNYAQRMSYRMGAYYTEDYLKILGNGVRECGVTAGVGFPTPEGKTMINLGVEWKMRQAHPVALLRENYINVTLGVNFNEVWFFKRKIR